MTVPAPTRGSWWRSQRVWLAGALVLGAIAFVRPYFDALHEYRRFRPHDPVDVARGQWAHYAGARWRLVDASLKTATGPGSAFDLQRLDSAVLVLRYEVVPDPGTDAARLDACKGRLTDARGREWDNNPLPLSRYRSPERLSAMCGSRLGADFKRETARPGHAFAFEHLYQVPRSADWRAMQAGISVPDREADPDGGRYLRFGLR